MQANVILRDHEGREHELTPGEIVGRSWSAGLLIDDGRVSEAHALLSLREGQLQLIALRGAFGIGGEPRSRVTLVPGQRIELARGLTLDVVSVTLPEHLMALEGEGFGRHVLPPVCSLIEGSEVRLVPGWREEATVHVWSTGGDWIVQRTAGTAHPLCPGDRIAVGPVMLQAVAIELSAAGRPATLRMGEVDSPLVIVAHYDTVHVHGAGGRPTVFNGRQARLISELVAAGTPVSWTGLSEQLWPDEPDLHVRRSRLDVLLSKMRRTLRAHGVRSDLVRMDGTGLVELLLYARDRVEDHT